jgi:hypothetical protein
MHRSLIFATIVEIATGLALLIIPSLVAELLLGQELGGVAIPVAQVAGIALVGLGIACWPWSFARRHVDLQRGCHAVSGLPRLRGQLRRHPALAGRYRACNPDSAVASAGETRSTKLIRRRQVFLLCRSATYTASLSRRATS